MNNYPDVELWVIFLHFLVLAFKKTFYKEHTNKYKSPIKIMQDFKWKMSNTFQRRDEDKAELVDCNLWARLGLWPVFAKLRTVLHFSSGEGLQKNEEFRFEHPVSWECSWVAHVHRWRWPVAALCVSTRRLNCKHLFTLLQHKCVDPSTYLYFQLWSTPHLSCLNYAEVNPRHL